MTEVHQALFTQTYGLRPVFHGQFRPSPSGEEENSECPGPIDEEFVDGEDKGCSDSNSGESDAGNSHPGNSSFANDFKSYARRFQKNTGRKIVTFKSRRGQYVVLGGIQLDGKRDKKKTTEDVQVERLRLIQTVLNFSKTLAKPHQICLSSRRWCRLQYILHLRCFSQIGMKVYTPHLSEHFHTKTLPNNPSQPLSLRTTSPKISDYVLTTDGEHRAVSLNRGLHFTRF